VSVAPPPSAEAQLVFLSKLQRLFAEGDFTATYKYALLIALADLAVELGAEDGAELVISTRQIGERFIGLYWKHATPYGAGAVDAQPGVLVQNLGAQAAVVSAIAVFRQAVPASSPQVASKLPSYRELLGDVTTTVSAQPLNYLQNFGGKTDEFLYERLGKGKVRLKPGVAYCLRRFQPLVQQLARSNWIDHIKGNRRNWSVLGHSDDLGAFLFGLSRQSLLLIGGGLRKLDGKGCFYCGLPLGEADVDHFVPFSLYPRDLAHNFVLAHPSCNRSKSDMLAAKPHLERWLERLVLHSDALEEVGSKAGVVVDESVCRRVASWGYSSAHECGGHAWIEGRMVEPITIQYVDLLS
jgi:5-methylcytosine-specific restriction endonuclease McrA